jgi:hypothetical protein
LATRQLFEKVQKSQDTIDHYISVIGKTFKEFPPYVNDILNMPEYKFNSNAVSAIDTLFTSDMHNIQNQIVDLNDQLIAAPDEERKILKEKIKALRQEMEYRRWQAYILFLRSKNPGLADVFAQLVASKFDFSTLS